MSSTFENMLPGERPSLALKERVRGWLGERGFQVRDRGEYLVFRLDFSFIAIFSYAIPLKGATVDCLSLEAFVMGKAAAEYFDQEDLAELNRRILLGELMLGQEGHLLLVYNILAEGMTREGFNHTLGLFKEGIESVDRQVARLMASLKR